MQQGSMDKSDNKVSETLEKLQRFSLCESHLKREVQVSLLTC